MRRVHVLINGKVQGVFFRSGLSKLANDLDVRGWVRNNPDGTLECVLEGTEAEVAEIIDWCKMGPEGSVVDMVEVKDEPYHGEFKKFFVLY